MHAGIKRAYKQYRAYKDIDNDALIASNIIDILKELF